MSEIIKTVIGTLINIHLYLSQSSHNVLVDPWEKYNNGCLGLHEFIVRKNLLRKIS